MTKHLTLGVPIFILVFCTAGLLAACASAPAPTSTPTKPPAAPQPTPTKTTAGSFGAFRIEISRIVVGTDALAEPGMSTSFGVPSGWQPVFVSFEIENTSAQWQTLYLGCCRTAYLVDSDGFEQSANILQWDGSEHYIPFPPSSLLRFGAYGRVPATRQVRGFILQFGGELGVPLAKVTVPLPATSSADVSGSRVPAGLALGDVQTLPAGGECARVARYTIEKAELRADGNLAVTVSVQNLAGGNVRVYGLDHAFNVLAISPAGYFSYGGSGGQTFSVMDGMDTRGVPPGESVRATLSFYTPVSWAAAPKDYQNRAAFAGRPLLVVVTGNMGYLSRNANCTESRTVLSIK